MKQKPGSISALEKSVAQAMALHQSGDLPAAQTAYEKILILHPTDPNVLMNLSTLHAKQENPKEAEKLLKKLIIAHPKIPYAHFGYANLLMKQKRHEDALKSYDRAIALDPTNASFYYNRGLALDALKRFEDALASYDRALELKPDHAEAFNNRGNTLNYLERFDEALATTEKSLILTIDPAALNTRGNALNGLGRIEEALDQYDRALAVAPEKGDTYNNRANVLNRLGRYEEALVSTERALALNAESALTHNTRGIALNGLWRFAEALTSYQRAIEFDPDLGGAYWNIALIQLMYGNYVEGLPFYEWRWKTEPQNATVRIFDQPLWLGDTPLTDKTILIYPEQGLGDFIQCARYFSLLAEQSAHVILETPAPLVALLTESFTGKNITVIPAKQALPSFDLQCPIMSLPHAFHVTLDTLPNSMPYLSVSSDKHQLWQRKLGPKTRTRIGLVWSGATAHLNDKNRSIPLHLLAPILRLPFEFHTLQKEVREDDLTHLGPLHLHAANLHNFTDTAALAEQMDLIISVDTSVAHLAGALGKPVWILLPHFPDYRWMLERTDSPLYPTARLFRQATKSDWPTVIEKLAATLATMSE